MTTSKVFGITESSDPFRGGDPPKDKFKILNQAVQDLAEKKITQEQFEAIRKSLQ